MDGRRESLWSVLAKFPTTFASDVSPSRKVKETKTKSRRPDLAPIRIPESPEESFFDFTPTPSASARLSYTKYQCSHSDSQSDSPSIYSDSPRLSMVTIDLESPRSPPPRPSYSHPTSAPQRTKSLKRAVSADPLSNLRSHWSDDSSDECDDDEQEDGDERSASPLSPTFLEAWRSRFGVGHSRSLSHTQGQKQANRRRSHSSPASPVPELSPRSKPVERGVRGDVRQGSVDDKRRSWSYTMVRRTPRANAVEDVAWQFKQWRGFVSKSG